MAAQWRPLLVYDGLEDRRSRHAVPAHKQPSDIHRSGTVGTGVGDTAGIHPGYAMGHADQNAW